MTSLSDIQVDLVCTREWNGIRADWEHATVLEEIFLRDAYRAFDVVDGDVVLDLGAHIGAFARKILEDGAAKVIAVEPFPPSVRILRENVESFGDRVSIIEAAVVSDEGTPTVPLHVASLHSYANTTRPARESCRGFVIPVEGIAFQKLLELGPTKVKCDIEGAEYDVLLPNSEALDESAVSQIICEIHVSTDEQLELAHGMVSSFKRRGWKTTSKKRLPGKPNGWGTLWCWTRETKG